MCCPLPWMQDPLPNNLTGALGALYIVVLHTLRRTVCSAQSSLHYFMCYLHHHDAVVLEACISYSTAVDPLQLA